MLDRLRFTNFKSWPEADLKAGRITGIFGTNSSGKTSLLQFLLLLKQTKDATDRALSLDLNGPLVQLGTVRDVIHRHRDDSALDWSVTFQLEKELALADPSGRGSTVTIAKGRTLTVGSWVAVTGGKLSPQHLRYMLGGDGFEIKPRKAGSGEFDLNSFSTKPEEPYFRFVRTQGRPWGLPPPVKSYAFPDQARTYFQNSSFLADLEAAYEAQMDQIFYLGPLREFPSRDYLWARSRPTDVGLRGEKAIDAILAASEAGDMRNLRPKARLQPFQKIVSQLLQDMGLIDSFRVGEIARDSDRWQARIKTRKGASEVLLTDVGFGVSQVLPVVTLLQYVPEGATVILEQPEIHLHPLAQAGLADVIIQAAMHRRVQVILESHSEHVLLRLQRRIAEGAIEADLVKLYFCDAPGGASTLTPLDVDMLGNIRNWPDKFMGDAFTETAEAERARLHRMRAAE